jgi:MscS family membrane protein
MSELTGLLDMWFGPWTVQQLLLALGFVVAGIVLRALLNLFVARRLRELTSRTGSQADDHATEAVISPLGVILPVIGVYLAVRMLLAVQPQWLHFTDLAFRVISILVVVWTAFRLVDALAILLSEVASRTESRLDDQIVPLVRKALKTFLGILAFILVAQNLGYSVSGVLAGLGIGGLALAMAAKDTLANFFGSIMILMDRPFHVGDWITFDGGEGVVEDIGLRSTRVRTFAKTVVSIPNQALANATIENHSLMPKRRIKFSLGVTYASTADQVGAVVERVEGYLRGNPDIDQEFIQVKFTDFGASSLDLFVYCFTVTTDWTEHLLVRQDVNLRIMAPVEETGLSIAFPTRTVHLLTGNGSPVASTG